MSKIYTGMSELVARVDLPAMVERDGVTLRGHAERYGPCPKCGGDDRFHVRQHGGRWWFFCRSCHVERGDSIEYLRWAHGMTTGDAIRALGGDTSASHAPLAKRVPVERMPDEFPPCERWMCKARAFSDACAAKLWTPEGAAALAYLRGRGLSDDTIRAAGLGFNPMQRKAAGIEWGLIDRDTVYAAAGITIPYRVAGWMWCIRIRRLNADGTAYKGDDKYLSVTGSKAALFGADCLRSGSTALLCGGEFDALLAQQHAPSDIVAVTFGSESKSPTLRWRIALGGLRVLVAFDNDAAGDTGAAKWAAIGERVRVPSGKDITEYAQQGGDLGAWLAAFAPTRPALEPWPIEEPFTNAVLNWLESAGYEPEFGEDGCVIAK